jgi:hypothetical protein
MGKERSGVNLECKACKKEFYVPDYRKETAKFCSLECQNHKQYDKYIFNCASCGKEVVSPPSRKNYKKKFCSRDCQTSTRMSEKERRAMSRSLFLLKRGNHASGNLRKYIFIHKPKVCEVCSYSEYDFCLDIHHKDNDPANNELSNLAVLCCMCHKKLHKGIITLE